MRIIVLIFCLLFFDVCAQQKLDCNSSITGWIVDKKINGCTFTPPTINSQYITSIEFGNNVNINSTSYHCYYIENKICNTNDCKECNENYVFDFMLSNKKFVAPTDETGVVSDCSATLVNIPGSFYNPIVTTVHSSKYSIINYTVYIYRSPAILSTGHLLHPGKVQRTIIKKGDDLFVATLGDGTGWLGGVNNFLAPYVWNEVDKNLISAFKCKSLAQPTLFLFDVSGSMNENNKWASAKQAATSTLDFLFDQANQNNKTASVGLMSYAGGCVDDPTNKVLDFSSDKATVKNAINNNLPSPGGSTPTPQAIQKAEAFLKQQLQSNKQCEGDLIILTDGQSSCGAIRPPGTYSITVNSKVYTPCQTNSSGSVQLRYQTIGFDIAPGSEAEKDMQYLASANGGRYFHATNMTELKRAFEKISRVFVPIENNQASTMPSSNEASKFKLGVELIKGRNYDSAFSIFKRFAEKYPNDSAGLYNYAQMSEATDQYKLAAKNYGKYLQQNPQVSNRTDIETTIKRMNDYYTEYFAYQKEIVKKDLAFLNDHFKKLMNGQSIPLANEFTGFIKEKALQYSRLPSILGATDQQTINLCNDIIAGFKIAQRRINNSPKDWDQDAVPVISVLYLKLEKLVALLEPLQPQ